MASFWPVRRRRRRRSVRSPRSVRSSRAGRAQRIIAHLMDGGPAGWAWRRPQPCNTRARQNGPSAGRSARPSKWEEPQLVIVVWPAARSAVGRERSSAWKREIWRHAKRSAQPEMRATVITAYYLLARGQFIWPHLVGGAWRRRQQSGTGGH